MALLMAGILGPLDWTELAPLPDAIGFGGPFAGVTGGAPGPRRLDDPHRLVGREKP